MIGIIEKIYNGSFFENYCSGAVTSGDPAEYID